MSDFLDNKIVLHSFSIKYIRLNRRKDSYETKDISLSIIHPCLFCKIRENALVKKYQNFLPLTFLRFFN